MKKYFPALLTIFFYACQPVSTHAGNNSAEQTGQDSTAPVAAASGVKELLTETDTVTIGGRLYNIVPVTEEEYNAVPSFMPDTSEAKNMAPFSARVTRNGDTLSIKLENGKEEIMLNNPNDNDDYAQYQFLGFRKDIHHYVVERTGYEWHEVLLIHAGSGKMTETLGVPNVSPDNKFAICSNTDLFAGFTTNGFELLRITAAGAEIVQSRLLEKWGPLEIKWLNATTLAGRIKVIRGNEDAQMEEEERLVKFVPR